MPMHYQIDRERRFVLSRGVGTLTDEDVLGHQRELRAEEGFQSDMNQLIDLSQTERFDLGASTLRQIVAMNPFGKGSRRALVSPGDLAFGMSRMFEAFSDGSEQEIRVFRDMAEARSWLGADGADD